MSDEYRDYMQQQVRNAEYQRAVANQQVNQQKTENLFLLLLIFLLSIFGN